MNVTAVDYCVITTVWCVITTDRLFMAAVRHVISML